MVMTGGWFMALLYLHYVQEEFWGSIHDIWMVIHVPTTQQYAVHQGFDLVLDVL